MTKEVERPPKGGSWVRNPKTGKLSPAGKSNDAGSKTGKGKGVGK